jgi:DNA-binding LytR/AlgR family response regulator
MTIYPDINEVEYLRADTNYTVIVRVDGKKVISGYNLKKVMQLHYQDFIRVNRAIAVNPAMISEKTENQITLINQTFTISRRRR